MMAGADTRPPDAVPKDRGIPEPLFGCAVDSCREQQTWPAKDMFFWNARTFSRESRYLPLNGTRWEPGWYCNECLAELGAVTEGLGLRVVRSPLSGRLTVGTRYLSEADRDAD